MVCYSALMGMEQATLKHCQLEEGGYNLYRLHNGLFGEVLFNSVVEVADQAFTRQHMQQNIARPCT